MKSIKPTGKSGIVSLDEAMRRAEQHTPAEKKVEEEICYHKDFLKFPSMAVSNADLKKLEKYKPFYVRKNPISRLVDPQGAASTFRNLDMFLPSAPLTLSFLAQLLMLNQGREDWKYILEQYGQERLYAQNTIVYWENEIVVHYPEDFNNKSNPAQYHYFLEDFERHRKTMLIKDVHNHPRMEDYVVGVTESALSVLDALGDRFGKPAKIIVPENPGKRRYSVWIGCDEENFVIDTSRELDAEGYARGVRESPPF